jgi:outer membrane protein OmpA-like peptidoglycan-associated protein
LETLGGIFDYLEYSISQPHIDKANNLLFFVSENFNNKGAKDIFYISLDNLNSEETPKPVGINTAYNEESPFVIDNTLYFSSDRPLGLGGFDIYRSNNIDSDVAYNLGKQVNSPYDEKYYSQYEQMQYLSSNKPVENKTELGFVNCYNIYSYQTEEEKPIPVEEEIVIEEVPEIEEIVIEDMPEKEEEPVSSTTEMLSSFESIQSNVFFSNNTPAVNEADWNYETCLKSYQKLYDDYLSNTLDSAAFKDFFDNDVLQGFAQMNLTLDSLESLLEAGLKLEISVKAFTSPRASSQYNLALGERRCQAVGSYIKDWLKSKDLSHHLEDGSLKIITQSMGETTSPASVSSDILNRALSVYAVDASYERRVEFELKKQ